LPGDPGGAALEIGKDLEAGDSLEVPQVAGGDRIPAFECAGADQQVIEWDDDALLRRFGMDFSGQFRGAGRDRIDRHRGLQVVEEGAAYLAAFRRVGAMDAMGEFGHADRAERRFAFADPFGNLPEEARHVESLPLGLDHDARIEDHS